MASSPNTNLGVSSGKSYQDKFDPQEYLHFYDDFTEFETESLRLLHELHHSYGSTSSGQLKVLDYGAGPTVWCAISAALQASEIVLADYTEKNREALQGWLKRDPEAHDWTPFFKYVVQSLEGLGEAEVAKRQEDVRTLTKVVKCDIHADPPIQSGYEGPYDVVCSSFCLECASSSLEEYEIAIIKLSTLLKPGGKILLRCMEAEDNAPTYFYMVGAHKFVGLNITETSIRSTLEKAGFYNISLKRQLRDTPGLNIPPEETDFSAVLLITATKK